MVRWRNFLPLLCSVFLFYSCVGTLENKNAIKTETAKTATPTLNFSGVTAAIPISDSKVDVYFNAGSGNSADLKYLIYVNDSKNPIEVSGNKVFPSLARPGEFKYTVERLKVNTSYSFSVGVKDTKTGLQSNVNKSLSAKTFLNLTANFNGILSAKPLEGSLGTTKMLLKWIPAVTNGGILGAMAEDPVAYRISYIRAEDGSATDLLSEGNPNVVTYISDATDATLIKTSTDPKLLKNLKKTINATTSVIIPDLLPGNKYYFLVRAIHTAYVDYRLLAGYEYEKNLNIFEAMTLEPLAPVTWNETSVVASIVADDPTLSRKNLNWDAASGPFKKYRVYVRSLGGANNPATSPDLTAIDLAINNGTAMPANNFGLVIAPDQPFIQLSSLNPYEYYNVVVATCLSDTCNTAEQKIISPIVNFQVLPIIAPFYGLVKIENPISSTSLDKISLKFDPPVMSAGFLTDIEVYCMPSAFSNPQTDSVLLTTSVTSSLVIAGKANCEGLTRITSTPANLSSFSSIEIQSHATKPFLQPGFEISGLDYCFAVVPVIKNGATVIHRDLANMVTKCSFIQKKLPTILEFPGSKKVCSELGSNSLVVQWDKPASGIYNGFSVFWRKNTGGAFQFADAITDPATVINPVMPFSVQSGKYYRQDILNPNATSFTIQGLEAGARYQYGVLAHDKQGVLFNYSEINTNINDCSISMPVAQFGEWVEIFAVGPKEDGRNAFTSKGYKANFLAEALNDYGQPVEVNVDTDGNLTTEHLDIYGNLTATTFNGAYGAIDNNPAKNNKMFSNQGIIRIAWKDITFSGGGSLNDLTAAYDKIRDAVTVTKPNRKYGYHVYRSADNQESWVKLTGSADVQTPDNLGLLHPSPYYEWKRANDGYLSGSSTNDNAYFDGSGSVKFNGVIFTDYSVAASQPTDASHTTERARVYYYKVVPVVNGIEVKLANGPSGSIIPQNIIRVVLPPPNMSFVSRLIANRQTCLELGKIPSKDVSTYYSCPYTGVGSKVLNGPAVKGDSVFVYDVGQDFMIDRYELGCNITRGSTDPDNSTLITATELDQFVGDAGDGSKFSGCFFEQEDTDHLQGYNATPVTLDLDDGVDRDSVAPPVYSTNRMLRKGDCLGYSSKSIKVGNYQYMINYPGLYGAPVTDSTGLTDFFTVYSDDLTKYAKFAAQSEYAAVHFNLARDYTSNWYPAYLDLHAKGGTDANKVRLRTTARGKSSCSVNLPVQVGAKVKPRWIPVNSLSHLRFYDGDGIAPVAPVDFSIVNKSMKDIKDTSLVDNYLYDDSGNKVPTDNNIPANSLRFSDSTKLGRVVSSNAAKMPPLIGLDQVSGQEICSTYEVEVGMENAGVWTKIKDKKAKRLMRRNEGIIAGAWPNYFKEGMARRVVDGFGKLTRIYPENNRHNITPNPPGSENIPPLVDAVKVEQGAPNISQINFANPTLTRPKEEIQGGCNSYERQTEYDALATVSPIEIMPGNLYKTNIYRAEASGTRSYFLTGSSYFDNDAALPGPDDYFTQSQLCTSKFGLQDLVGNVKEISGEKIYCNSAAVTLGAKIGLYNANASTEVDPRVEAGSQLYRKDLVTAKGYISDLSYQDEMGSCSVVSDTADRSPASMLVVFTDGASIFKTLLDMWGSFTDLVNSVFRNQHDPRSVENLRSADGYFLDFGDIAIGAPLIHGDELAIYNNPNLSNKSPYFSPVIGLPLKCPDTVCGTILTPPVSDNKKVSTQTLNLGGSLDVPNFPIGNSQIASDGVLETEDEDRWRLPGSYPEALLSNVVNAIVRPGMGADYASVADYAPLADGPFDIARARWATDYSEPFRFFNFGSINDAGSGRYSVGVHGDVIQEQYYRKSGARCAISID